MSEEIKKEAQDTELRLEDLDKVAGGEISIDLLDKGEIGYWYVARCPYCSFNIEFPATSSLEDSEEIEGGISSYTIQLERPGTIPFKGTHRKAPREKAHRKDDRT